MKKALIQISIFEISDPMEAALAGIPTGLMLLDYPYTLDDLLDGDSPFRKSARAEMQEDMAEACDDAAVDLIETAGMLGIDGDTPVTLAYDEDGFIFTLTIEADLDDTKMADDLLAASMDELAFTSPSLTEGNISPNHLMYLTTVTLPWSIVRQALEEAFDTDSETLLEEESVENSDLQTG